MKLDQIRWDSVAKIGAGVLLAVAIATSLPSLLGSEEPKPLEPDVGLPQAALPPPVPPAPPAPAVKPKKRPEKRPKSRKQRKHPKKPKKTSAAPTPVLAMAAPVTPTGSTEDFGFERP